MSLPEELADKWEEAMRTGERVPVGEIVVCDFCNADFTASDESGGFVFQSKAVCPRCAPEMLPKIEAYHEDHLIRARCPEGTSFADFVREFRGPNAAILWGVLDG